MTVDYSGSMQGMVVALMVSNGFTEVEFTELQRAIAKAGATLKTISCDNGLVNGWAETGFGHYFPIDAQLGDVLAADLDALIIPGGERSINKLKANLNTGRILRNMVDGHKPVVLFGAAAELPAIAGREAGETMLVIASRDGMETSAWVEQSMAHMIACLAEDTLKAAA